MLVPGDAKYAKYPIDYSQKITSTIMINTNHITMNGIIVCISIHISVYDQLLSFMNSIPNPIDYPKRPYKFIDNESVRNLNYSYQCMLEHLELNYIDMNNYNGSTISFLVNDYSQHIYIYTIYKS